MPYADPEKRRASARERQRKYREANSERVRELARKRARENPELVARKNERRRIRRATDPEYRDRINRQEKARRHRRFQEDPEYREQIATRDREYRRNRYATDPQFREALNARIKRYVAANREVANERSRKCKQVRRARALNVLTIKFTSQQWLDKVEYWGDHCWICGGPWEAMDHVKPVSLGGPHVLSNLRPICKPCNSAKHNRWPLDQIPIKAVS